MLVAPPMKDKAPLLSHCCLRVFSRQYPLANTCKRTIQRTYHGLGTPGCYQLQFKVKTISKKRNFCWTDFKRDDRFQESYVSVGFPIYLLSNKRLGRFRRFEHNSRAYVFEKYGGKTRCLRNTCVIPDDFYSYSNMAISLRQKPSKNLSNFRREVNIRKSSEVLQNYKHFVQNLEDPLNQNDTVNQNDHLNLNWSSIVEVKCLSASCIKNSVEQTFVSKNSMVTSEQEITLSFFKCIF